VGEVKGGTVVARAGCRDAILCLDRKTGQLPKYGARERGSLLQRMETSPSVGSAGVAAELGYCDQAQLVNEVAQFAL